jgi:uncharacterized protein (TIGR02466 family)
MPVDRLFATPLYRTQLRGPAGLAETCLGIAAEDRAGRRWSKDHGYGGYTSYASLDDLPARASVFAELERTIARHARLFAREAAFDMGGRRLALDSLWINVMAKGGHHAAHIHPHSAISGTYYVTVPKGAGRIRFEDPRLPLMMAAPPRRKTAPLAARTFVDVTPKPGMLLLWESWLRHGVEANAAGTPRISVSFNYRIG